MKALLVSLILTLISLPTLAESTLRANATISTAGELVGSAALLMKSGEAVSRSVDGAYELSVIAVPTEEGLIQVTGDLHLPHESHPLSMLVEPAKESSVRMSDTTFRILIVEA